MVAVKMTADGQITIPAFIRKKMNLRNGDKIIFAEQDGRHYMENAALAAINRMQSAFEGEAERLGLQNEDDVVAMVKEIRRERWENRHASHA